MDTQKFIKPAKLQFAPKTNAKMPLQSKETDHDYANMDVANNKRERGADSAPPTPTKQPPEEKRTKPSDEGDCISNKTIFEAILGLEKKFETQLEDIKEQNRQSAAMVASLAKAVEFNAAEMKIAPDLKLEEAVDIVHRLGKRVDGRNRNIVILFSQRRIKEELWKRTKDSPVCKQEGISFAEMLPQEDLQDRQRLWPLIEEARRAGKRAYFRGPHAFIDGRKIEERREV
ncbi:hypothetical protein WMY93_029945 [Mugilogobius chulae]|uniref:L1 transposable element RRM domain-containing protein n=1 Tax=Mugilogobius chulae TaxID=88201 RepID=A0AAW0MQR1_9GOBI